MNQTIQNRIQNAFILDDGVGFAQILQEETPENLDSWFDKTLSEQKPQMLKVLIKHTLSLPGWNSKMNKSLPIVFKEACAQGRVEVLDVLLYYCKSSEIRESGLYLAADENQPKIIEKLLKAKVSAKGYQSHALRTAATKGYVEVVKLLIPHSDLNLADRHNKRTILELAVLLNQVEVVRILAPLCDATLNQSLALKKAVVGRKPAMVEILYPYSNIEDLISKLSEFSCQDVTNFKNVLKDSLYEKVDPIVYHSGFDKLGTLSPPWVQNWILENFEIEYLPQMARLQLNKVIPVSEKNKNQVRI